jgi:Glycosyl hydrolases family 16
MNKLKIHTVLILLFSIFTQASCKKSTSTTGNIIAPANLVVNAIASTDGSGNVSFTATADNAVTFDYEYGNGTFATVTSGMVTYKYTLAGTNTYTVKVTAKSSTGGTISKTILVTVNVIPSALSLVWSDEFNVDGLPNPAKWGYDIGNGSGGWGNNELEYYTNRSDNAVCINGNLKITLKKESFSGFNYTSARLLSQGKFAFKYGKVEARAKLPAGAGTWPAIWALGSNINTTAWPACGEIDIMEHIGNDLNKIYGTLHYPGRSGGNANGGTKIITNATTEFHLYTLEWDANTIKIYVDNVLFHSVTNSANIPFNHDFFLIMNVAMGGNFGGTVDPNFTEAAMEVDYIRVYQ